MGLPAFSLDIDDGAELATVRPREGELILVERVSPTEVVLRLRPADGSPAESPPAATAPPAIAEAPPAEEVGAAVSEAPAAQPEDAAVQPEGAEGGERAVS